MKRRRGGEAKRPVARLETVLSDVCKALAVDQKVQEWALLALWPQVVSTQHRPRTCATRLMRQGSETVLWVTAADAPTAGDLAFCLEDYRERLNAYAPQTGLSVSRIQVKIGSLG